MFILGYHFPAEMGNKIDDTKVVEKLEADVSLDGVKEIKLVMGKKKDTEISYTNMNTFMAKALVHFFLKDNESKDEKYMVYTDRYQISELSKRLDAEDDETMGICKKFDSMEPFRIMVA